MTERKRVRAILWPGAVLSSPYPRAELQQGVIMCPEQLRTHCIALVSWTLLNCPRSPVPFMNSAARAAHLLLERIFLRPVIRPTSAHISSWRSACSWQFNRTCATVCLSVLQLHSPSSIFGTHCLWRKYQSPMFPVHIWLRMLESGLSNLAWSWRIHLSNQSAIQKSSWPHLSLCQLFNHAVCM